MAILKRKSKQYYLRLPKKDPKNIAVMTNNVVGKPVITDVEFNNDIPVLIKYAPIIVVNGEIKPTNVNTFVERLLKRSRWELIINESLYNSEIEHPTKSVRFEAGTAFINFTSMQLGVRLGVWNTLGFLLGTYFTITGAKYFYRYVKGGNPVIDLIKAIPGVSTITAGELALKLVIGILILTASARSILYSRSTKIVVKRAEQRGYIVRIKSSSPEPTDIEEAFMPQELLTTAKTFFNSLFNGNNTLLNSSLISLVNQTIPKGTKSYSSIMKVIK